MDDWIGKEDIVEGVRVSAEQSNLMLAILNRQPNLKKGDFLPPAWHWLYFHNAVEGEKLGLEGHPALGQFMPPVSFGGDKPPRRMWAGGKIIFEKPLALGSTAKRISSIKAITPKEGRSGKLVFVTVQHEILTGETRHILEEQTIVYREPLTNKPTTQPPAPSPQPPAADFSHTYTPDPIMLFRYSALTFNSHRIHYDVDFSRDQEGYPGLVVHGPLIATLILDLFYQRDHSIKAFSYRGRAPMFNPHPFTVHGTTDGTAWAADHAGNLAMTAEITP